MIFITVAARNYLPKALFWAQTLRAAHPEAKLVLCQPERDIEHAEELRDHFDLCLAARELGLQDFARFSFRHSLMELSTAIKPRLFLYLMHKYPDEKHFVFLDPDVWVFSRMDEIESLLQIEDMLLTPHHLTDEDTMDGIRDNVLRTLGCGIFNLGFLALRRSPKAVAFLQWWMNKTEMLCYVDIPSGLFVDQKWIDLAFSFFKFHVLDHQGYNVANWNLSKRHLADRDDCIVVNQRWPLRFFHFSGMHEDQDLYYFNKYAPDPQGPAQRSRQRYQQALREIRDRHPWPDAWTYERYYSGAVISDEARWAVRLRPELLRDVVDPYLQSNEFFLGRQ